jgi:hypothetical protein
MNIPGPGARTNCELTQGLFVPLLFESQSGTLACNVAVFSDCSERIVGNPYLGITSELPIIQKQLPKLGKSI